MVTEIVLKLCPIHTRLLYAVNCKNTTPEDGGQANWLDTLRASRSAGFVHQRFAWENKMDFRWFSLTVPLLGLLALPLFATGPTGTITGTVTDPSGASVPKAAITVRNLGTNATRETRTNDDGDYTVALLPVGTYRVSVEKTGFRRSFYNDVILDVEQTVRVDFALQIGQITNELEVKDTPPLVQTDTSTLGQVLNGRQVHELPLNERNFLSFALLVPGSHTPTEGSQNSTQGGALTVDGAREQSNNFLLDGVDNNDPYINQYVTLPSVDAIQEFKVQSSDYSAEFGRSGGAQINVILKSGTNEFHGGLFEFLRNRHMDAKNFFDQPACTPSSVPGTCGDIPRFDRNQFGGTLGGPVQKDKTFFFAAYEGLRLRQATTRETTVPSKMQIMEALGALPAAYINPAGQAILNLYPGGQRRLRSAELEHFRLLPGHPQFGEPDLGQSGPPRDGRRRHLDALFDLRRESLQPLRSRQFLHQPPRLRQQHAQQRPECRPELDPRDHRQRDQ